MDRHNHYRYPTGSPHHQAQLPPGAAVAAAAEAARQMQQQQHQSRRPSLGDLGLTAAAGQLYHRHATQLGVTAGLPPTAAVTATAAAAATRGIRPVGIYDLSRADIAVARASTAATAAPFVGSSSTDQQQVRTARKRSSRTRESLNNNSAPSKYNRDAGEGHKSAKDRGGGNRATTTGTGTAAPSADPATASTADRSGKEILFKPTKQEDIERIALVLLQRARQQGSDNVDMGPYTGVLFHKEHLSLLAQRVGELSGQAVGNASASPVQQGPQQYNVRLQRENANLQTQLRMVRSNLLDAQNYRESGLQGIKRELEELRNRNKELEHDVITLKAQKNSLQNKLKREREEGLGKCKSCEAVRRDHKRALRSYMRASVRALHDMADEAQQESLGSTTPPPPAAAAAAKKDDGDER